VNLKPGDLVRVIKRDSHHGGKIAVVIAVGREQKSTFDGSTVVETVDVFMEGAIRTGVRSSWFEAINEAG